MADNGIVGNAEKVRDAMAQRLVEAHQTIVGDIGPRKFDQQFIPERQQARNAGFGFHDPSTWEGIVNDPTLGPAAAIQHFQRSLQLKEKFPDEFQYGVDASGAQMQQPTMPMEQPPAQAMPQQMPPEGGM